MKSEEGEKGFVKPTLSFGQRTPVGNGLNDISHF